MKESEIKKGIKVFIANTYNTKNTHTTNVVMKSMLNKVYKIQYNKSTRHGLAAVIDGYKWHPKDLILFKPAPIKKPKIPLFDIKELVI